MHHVEGKASDRGKKMAVGYVEKMTLKVDQFWIQGM